MLRERAAVPTLMHPLAESQIARLSHHVRRVRVALFATGTARFALAAPIYHASDLKSQALTGLELPIPAMYAQPHAAARHWAVLPLKVLAAIIVLLFGLFWCNDLSSYSRLQPIEQEAIGMDTVAEQIIKVESDGNPNAKNKASSATGLGQFVNETWLILMRTNRPDLIKGRSEGEILEMRRDAAVAREVTLRFTERNAWILRKRGLPVTPRTLYLAHFTGSAGAVAILSADGQADAATIMASADATRRTNREKLVKLNPFLDRLTVADLKLWADRKMRVRSS